MQESTRQHRRAAHVNQRTGDDVLYFACSGLRGRELMKCVIVSEIRTQLEPDVQFLKSDRNANGNSEARAHSATGSGATAGPAGRERHSVPSRIAWQSACIPG